MSQYDPVVPSDPYSIPDPDAGTDLFDLTHLLTVGATWLTAVTGVVTLSLVVWRLRSPATFRRYVATPVSLARVMGPPFCHEHGTGCFRLLAVVMVTDEMAAGQFGWSELTGFAGRGF